VSGASCALPLHSSYHLLPPALPIDAIACIHPVLQAWNSETLPIYEPGLDEVVKACRNRNLFFSSDTTKHLAEADMIFVRCGKHVHRHSDGNQLVPIPAALSKPNNYTQPWAGCSSLFVPSPAALSLLVCTLPALHPVLNGMPPGHQSEQSTL
jgi:hypothetical protein